MPTEKDELVALLEAQSDGFCLDQTLYNSPVVFNWDLERIYQRHWLYAGPVCRIPRPGDYFLYQVGTESIIIIRGEDNQVRAFFNVCRHRGSQICWKEEGHVKQFVCPYHAWTYGTDGNLIAARHLVPEIERSDYGLNECNIALAGGFIFVCLAEEAPDFSDMATTLNKYYGPHQLERTKICKRFRHLVKANWKIVVENFCECYHCGPAHPELAQVMSYVRAYDSKRAAAEREEYTIRWKEKAERLGYITEGVFSLEGVQHEASRIPIREGFFTQSRNGKPVSKLLGDLREYDGGITTTQFWPFTWLVACNDHAMAPRVTPLTPSETEIEVLWLVREDAVEGVDYNPDEVSWMWETTFIQDVAICEGNQRGVNSSRYRPGPYVLMEDNAQNFIKWYLSEMRLATDNAKASDPLLVNSQW